MVVPVGMDFQQRSLYTPKHDVGLTRISNEQMLLMAIMLFISIFMWWGKEAAPVTVTNVVTTGLHDRPLRQRRPGVFLHVAVDPDEAVVSTRYFALCFPQICLSLYNLRQLSSLFMYNRAMDTVSGLICSNFHPKISMKGLRKKNGRTYLHSTAKVSSADSLGFHTKATHAWGIFWSCI